MMWMPWILIFLVRACLLPPVFAFWLMVLLLPLLPGAGCCWLSVDQRKLHTTALMIHSIAHLAM